MVTRRPSEGQMVARMPCRGQMVTRLVEGEEIRTRQVGLGGRQASCHEILAMLLRTDCTILEL